MHFAFFTQPIWIVLVMISMISPAQADPFAGQTDDTVLMRHGPVTITQADFQAELQRIPEKHRDAFLTSSERIRKVLASMFTQKVLAQEAREAGLDQDPLVKERIELAVDKLLAEVRIEHLIEEAPQPDFEALAREYYQANPDQFQIPEQVHASHILISTAERSEEEARARAEKVLDLVRQGEKSFSELAVEYSDDPSVTQNRGDLGFFGRGKMVKPFEEAAFGLENPGDISPLVETQFGFHIIRLEEHQPAGKLSFAKVKEKLIEQEKQKYEARVRNMHVSRIRSMDDIEVNQEAIEALKTTVDFSKATVSKSAPSE